MKIDQSCAAGRLQQADRILILTHGNPDGDTLGSGYALLRALRALGKQAEIACSDPIPEKYAYLYEGLICQEMIPEYIVAVDVADSKLLGTLKQYQDRVDLCIDHHGSNTLYAKETLLSEESASTTELIYQLLLKMECPITKEIADAIYTGLATDTGCFCHSNTTALTHRAAAAVMDAGADAERINQKMFNTKSLTYVKLERLALESLQLHYNGRCAVMLVTQEMFRESGSNEDECDGIAGLPRQIAGVQVGITLREKEDGTWKASVRTVAPIDASALCAKMGGGGHPRASGCSLKGTRQEVLEEMLLHTGDALGEPI